MELVSFKLKGLEQLLKSFSKRHDKLKNNKSAYAACVIEVDKWTQNNFKTEGGNVGGWQPLSPRTLEARRHGKGNHSTKILQDTGSLKGHWKSFWDNNNGYFQSMTDYGQEHDQGSSKKNIPQRRIIPLPEEMKDKFKEIFSNFIKKALS